MQQARGHRVSDQHRASIDEGYLVDYDAIAVESGVLINGVFLKEGERVRTVDTQSGAQNMDQLEDERQFEATEVEKKMTVPGTNRKIIEELKKYALEHEQRYGRFPKTLVSGHQRTKIAVSAADRRTLGRERP
ncbi:MAG: hypothetical protein ACYDC3_09855 [Candidatus Binataceae bacterium]